MSASNAWPMLCLIGHLKHDHRIGRNFLLSFTGDKINALMAACAFNLRKLARRFLLPMFAAFARAMATVIATLALFARSVSVCARDGASRFGASAATLIGIFQGRLLRGAPGRLRPLFRR